MRIRALILRIIRQFLRDKRTLALLIAAPLLVLTLMYFVLNGNTVQLRIGIIQLPEAIRQGLERANVAITTYTEMEEADTALAQQTIDAYIGWDGGAPLVMLEGSNPSKSRAALMVIQKTLQSQAPVSGQPVPHSLPAPRIEYKHGSADMSSFDYLGPVLIGVFSFFFVFLIAGVSFLKERTSGTLERLLATPLRRWEIVAGYIIGFGIFTSLQAVLIAWYTIHVLGIMMAGSTLYVLLITLLLSVTALSFGTFLSAFANTEFQMIQFIPLVIVPQIFFSGLFDLDSMSPWLRWLSHLMPLKYGADALRSVMIRGEGWSAIAPDLYVLLALALIFMLANVQALRKHRHI